MLSVPAWNKFPLRQAKSRTHLRPRQIGTQIPLVCWWRVIFPWKSFSSCPSKGMPVWLGSPSDSRGRIVRNPDIPQVSQPGCHLYFEKTDTYTVGCMKNSYITPAIATGMTSNITPLQDTVSHLERICNTPLPFAYQAHLHMPLWLYLLFLPVSP
jgi:hypothetical protein